MSRVRYWRRRLLVIYAAVLLEVPARVVVALLVWVSRPRRRF